MHQSHLVKETVKHHIVRRVVLVLVLHLGHQVSSAVVVLLHHHRTGHTTDPMATQNILQEDEMKEILTDPTAVARPHVTLETVAMEMIFLEAIHGLDLPTSPEILKDMLKDMDLMIELALQTVPPVITVHIHLALMIQVIIHTRIRHHRITNQLQKKMAMMEKEDCLERPILHHKTNQVPVIQKVLVNLVHPFQLIVEIPPQSINYYLKRYTLQTKNHSTLRI